MEDLLHGFTDPNVMDIKMGTRTFLESEVTNTTARSDLYQKVQYFGRNILLTFAIGEMLTFLFFVLFLFSRRLWNAVGWSQMMKVEPSAATQEEHELQAVTKLRYMMFREQQSSSCNLGFRIEAIKVSSLLACETKQNKF